MENREYIKTVRYIFELIENGMIHTGDKLPTERTFSEKLGISRNSVREALRTLENLGLVESRQGSGNYLTNNVSAAISKAVNIMLMMNCITRAEVGQFRRSMDKSVCHFLINNGCSDKFLKELAEDYERMKNAPDRISRTNADTDFHLALIHATENRLWVTMFDAVSEVYRRLIGEVLLTADHETTMKLVGLHGEILSALINGDEESCITAVNKHYDITDALLKDNPKEQPFLFK